MASGKDGKDGGPAKIAKVAGVAVAAGAVTWSIVGFLKGKKEAEPVVQVDEDPFADLGLEIAEAADESLGSQKEIDVLYVERQVIAAVVDVPKAEKSKIEAEDSPKVAAPPEASAEKKPWFQFLLNMIQKGTEKPKAGKEGDDGKEKKKKPGADGKPGSGKELYEIKKGDTLWAISGKYGISLDSLKAANGLHGDKIYAGDNLVIPDV